MQLPTCSQARRSRIVRGPFSGDQQIPSTVVAGTVLVPDKYHSFMLIQTFRTVPSKHEAPFGQNCQKCIPTYTCVVYAGSKRCLFCTTKAAFLRILLFLGQIVEIPKSRYPEQRVEERIPQCLNGNNASYPVHARSRGPVTVWYRK